MSEKTKYTVSELKEFKKIILEKIKRAKEDLEILRAATANDSENLCRVFTNVGDLLMTALEVVGLKIINFHRILFYSKEIKQIYQEVR